MKMRCLFFVTYFVCLLFSSLVIQATPMEFAKVKKLLDAADSRTKVSVTYDGRYHKLDYPGGDVPKSIGVCTDLIIRSYRSAFKYDFQKTLHEDMKQRFSSYPPLWGLKKPDTNIDHRRVPNLEFFLKKYGTTLSGTRNSANYKPGDLVTWNIGGTKRFIPHIGIVSNKRTPKGIPLIYHNIGEGPKLEDTLFAFPIRYHFRFFPK